MYDLESWLMELIDYSREEETVEVEDIIKSCRTFQETGLLTRNKGLAVTLNDGSKFQITIVPVK